MADLIKRFQDPDNLTDEELLTLLLRYGQSDPAATAKRLLDRFHTVANLMEVDADDLRTVEGLKETSVLLLQLVPELHRRYFISRNRGRTTLHNTSDYAAYMMPCFYGVRNEQVHALLLDANAVVLECVCLGEGSVNSANVPVRNLVHEVLISNATGVVLAHNHPSGLFVPSKEDVELTMRLRECLNMMDVLLIDHLIIVQDDYLSMRESGYFKNFY